MTSTVLFAYFWLRLIEKRSFSLYFVISLDLDDVDDDEYRFIRRRLRLFLSSL